MFRADSGAVRAPVTSILTARRRFLRGLVAAALFGGRGRPAPTRAVDADVGLEFEDCSTAVVTNASAVASLSVYCERRFDRRTVHHDIPTTVTDTRTYRPLQLRHDAARDRTRVTLAARGSLVRIVAVSDTGERTGLTNGSPSCAPPGFNEPPRVSLVTATEENSVGEGETLAARVGETVTFVSTATDPDAPAERLRYGWDLDGDGVFETRGRRATTAYAEPGSVVVGHRVTDDFDETRETTLTVDVRRSWRLRRKLTPDDVETADQFGLGIAVSGDTLVCGAPGDDDRGTNAGAAYVYDLADLTRPPIKLTPGRTTEGDLAALSVAVGGESLALSAVCDDDVAPDAGAVYVYDLTDLSASPTKLRPTCLLPRDVLGFSLALLDDTLVAGAHLDGERADWAGSVFVFDLRNRSLPPTKLAPADLATRDLFGISVAVTESIVVAGAVGDDDAAPDAGAVYVYDRTNRSVPPRKLTPDGLAAADQFGRPVAARSETLAVGVPFDDGAGTQAGAVYAYDLTDLDAPPTRLVPEGLAPGDLFGYSVALSGRWLAVGAMGDDDGAFDGGAVYVYDLTDLSVPPTKVVPDGLSPGDLFGFSVSVSDDTLAVGALFDDDRGTTAGAVYVFER